MHLNVSEKDWVSFDFNISGPNASKDYGPLKCSSSFKTQGKHKIAELDLKYVFFY